MKIEIMKRSLIDLFYEWWNSELDFMTDTYPDTLYDKNYPFQTQFFAKWLRSIQDFNQ